MEYILSRLTQFIIMLPTTLIALMCHEIAHGWVSTKLGDPTPKMQGRLTFNPLAHLDPIGTLLMIFTGFGWARPVEVNPMYYKNRKQGMALVALAGPLANFILAIIGAFFGILLLKIFSFSYSAVSFITTVMYVFVVRNINFMVFNLIPLPPLDGSKILGMVLPNRTYYTMLQYERYAIIILMVLSLSGAFDRIIGTVGYGVWNLIITMASSVIL